MLLLCVGDKFSLTHELHINCASQDKTVTKVPIRNNNPLRMPRAVPVPIPFGDLALQVKKVAKKSCLAAHALGVDDDREYESEVYPFSLVGGGAFL